MKKFEKIRRVSKNFETYRSSCKVITFDDNYSGKKIEKNRHQKKKRKKINASGREKEREKKMEGEESEKRHEIINFTTRRLSIYSHRCCPITLHPINWTPISREEGQLLLAQTSDECQ